MTTDQFNELSTQMDQLTVDTLIAKAKEYAADGDRLHNFKVAAKMEGCNLIQALGGMMAKHTVSIYDMIGSGEFYDESLWAEKIKDHINYLYLLWAAIHEDLIQSEV